VKNWRKSLLYLLCLSGCFLISTAVIIACSDEPDPYDYYTSYFHADIQGQKDYGAFYFTDYQFIYSDREPQSEYSINATEWAKHLGQPVQPADVEKIMYHLDSAGNQSVYYSIEHDAPLADSLASNRFLMALEDPKHIGAKKYFQFAKQAEFLNVSNYNYWEPAPLDTAGLTAAANQALQAATLEADPFLKLRYFYQAQKLNHYAENYEAAKSIYDQHINSLPSQSHVMGWALALKAGEERRLGDTSHAAYLFSKVFANYPERRIQAYRNYHYIGAPDEDILKLAQTPEEKANIYAINGFSNPEIEINNLEKVYDNAPSSPLVGVLLVREINKLEQYYLTPSLSNDNDQFYSKQATASVAALPMVTSIKWIFWIGALFFLAGAIALTYTIIRKHGGTAARVGFSVVLLAGAACLTWYFKSRSNSTEPQRLPQGSFFVAMPDSIQNKYDEHIEKLRGFCTTLVKDAQYPEPQIGVLGNAYLYFMQNKTADGLSVLKNLDGQKLSNKLSDQKEILNLLLSSQGLKQLKEVDEASLLPSLDWLNDKVKSESKPNSEDFPSTPAHYEKFAITQRNFYTHVLAPAYLRQGDTAKAALALLNSQNDKGAQYKYGFFRQMPDFWYTYLHSSHLKQIIDWKSNRPANKYMAFLSNNLKQVDNGNLYELLGTTQLREHQYEQAFATFKTNKARINFTRAEEEGTSSGNPFEATINDYGQPDTKGLNKLQFAQKMAQLEVALRKDPNNADAYFQMATGIYSTSTYGKAWHMISYLWSSYDFGRNHLYYYDGDYIKASLAKQYYLKARELSIDREFKAKCTFMAAKCDQKDHEAPSFMDDYDTYERKEKAYVNLIKQNSFFKEMLQYKSTEFYKRAVDECSYLKDFITSR
jgi:hypothetical protein